MVDMNGYKEIGRIEFSKELVFTLYGTGILALFAFGYLFLYIYSQFTGKHSGTINLLDMIPGLLLFAGTLILHELIHGIFVSMYGGKPRYGAGIYSMLPYLYTTTKSIFPRNRFIIICIAPLAVISITGVAVMAAFPPQWILLPLIVNASGSVGDLWMTGTLLRYPGHILVEDQRTGNIIYGRESDRPVKASSAGLGSKFLKGLTISFTAIFLLVIILPVALNIMGAESFTIGPQNSPFTIFEYSGPNKNQEFGQTLFLDRILSLSVIFGLVYAILTTVYKKGS
ncbi:MAG: DUF3267 domain-containing protein [Candidatus Methanoperedens sp.]|nr:DUF3267 domain-containing protein [Candidatus Methanoperedens sp.]